MTSHLSRRGRKRSKTYCRRINNKTNSRINFMQNNPEGNFGRPDGEDDWGRS